MLRKAFLLNNINNKEKYCNEKRKEKPCVKKSRFGERMAF